MPEIPHIEPLIQLNRDDALNLILASCGIQELSLAHIINTQAENADFALGLLDSSKAPATIEEIWAISRQQRAMMRQVFRSQMLIDMNVEAAIEAIMNGGS